MGEGYERTTMAVANSTSKIVGLLSPLCRVPHVRQGETMGELANFISERPVEEGGIWRRPKR